MAPRRVKKVKVGPCQPAACAAAAALHRRQPLPAAAKLVVVAPSACCFEQPSCRPHHCTASAAPTTARGSHCPAAAPSPCLQAKAPSQTFYFPFMAAPIPISLTEEDINTDLLIMQVGRGGKRRPPVVRWDGTRPPPAPTARDTRPSA